MSHVGRFSLRGCLCCAPVALPSARRPIAVRRSTPLTASAGKSTIAAAPAVGAARPGAAAQRERATTTASKLHRIDVHHHVMPPKYTEEMRALVQPPQLTCSIERSLEDMDKAGVATAITSITTPGVWLGDDAQGRRVARECNEYTAQLVIDYPGRFGMFAALPLPDTDGSLREIEHGLDVLKADGICLFTSYRDKWLGDAAFEPAMAELNRRKAVVFVHPEAPVCCRGLIAGVKESIIEYGTDTTRAIAGLLFSGTAYRYPDIRWIFSHGGGTLPMFAERFIRNGLIERNKPHVPNGVMAELTRFYYDVAQIGNPMGLSALKHLVPVAQILWGTDFPFRRGTEYLQPLADFFSADELRQIDRENALSLLPRWRTS